MLALQAKVSKESSSCSIFWNHFGHNTYTNRPSLISIHSFIVCKDATCTGSFYACQNANIPYAVGPSCSGELGSCNTATIGSADSSCTDSYSCSGAQLSGVDLIDSCNVYRSCYKINDNGDQISELINCCKEEEQCLKYIGADTIYAACVSHICVLTISSCSVIASSFVK